MARDRFEFGFTKEYGSDLCPLELKQSEETSLNASLGSERITKEWREFKIDCGWTGARIGLVSVNLLGQHDSVFHRVHGQSLFSSNLFDLPWGIVSWSLLECGRKTGQTL